MTNICLVFLIFVSFTLILNFASVNPDDHFGMDKVGSIPVAVLDSTTLIKLKHDADEGSMDASYFLGLLHYYGEGVTKDLTAAYRYFRESALKGHPRGACNLAIMLDSEDSSKDGNAAYAWYVVASKGGEARGMHGAGVMLYENRVPNYPEHERLADAFAHFSDAVALDYGPSYYYLALLYEYGAHFPQNFTVALNLYNYCCNSKKDSECCYNEALMVSQGRGTTQNYPLAYSLLNECKARFNHAGCTYYLAVMTGAGQGVPVDYEKSRSLFLECSTSGDIRFSSLASTSLANLGRLVDLANEGIERTKSEISSRGQEEVEYDFNSLNLRDTGRRREL